MIVAEAPGRAVDRIGDEHVVARLQEGEQRQRRGGESGRHRESRMRAFDRRDRVLQIGDGRQAVQAVTDARVLAARRLLELRHRREKHRRRAEHRRVDGAQELPGIAPQVQRTGCRLVLVVAHGCNAARIFATCTGTASRTSTTIASVGASSVANWLASNVGGM